MKKYEPAITVVSLTLLFAVLALLVTGAVMQQPDLPVPRMECKSIDPNEADIAWGKDAYSFKYDPNLLIDMEDFYSESVIFSSSLDDYGEWAVFKRKDEATVSCNISESEFLIGLPKFMYQCMGKVDQNTQYIIEWADPNEPEESLVITQSGTDIALPTLDEQAHREPNEVKE